MTVKLTKAQVTLLLLALRLYRMRCLFIAHATRFKTERDQLRADAVACKLLIGRLEKRPA
jgi:hypothetical protein